LARVHTSAQYDDWHNWYASNGNRILPPYAIKSVGDVKVGIVGCTTRRGPQVVGKWMVEGIEFTDCTREVPKYVAEVRAGH
jgi:2',3'-cyclic-nucleotide 2'-phosphodiesterase (5'-nucleotidase family)